MSDSILDHLSHRARTRETINFWKNRVPEYVKPHPKPIHLSDGLPNSGFYPVTKITYDFIDEPFSEEHSGSLSFNQTEQDKLKKLDLKRALNYGPNKGHQHTVDFFKEFVSFANKPAYDQWDLTVTCGTGDSLHKAFNLLINPGDVVMLEAYTYVPVINYIKAWGGDVVPVAMNFEFGGIDSEAMEELLDNWASGPYKDKPKPKVLYTIPTGQNPTGLTLTKEKRAKVYQLAQKHDFMIVEDDPYGYIQLGKYTDGVENPFSEGNYTASSFVQDVLPKSFLEFDTDGRVIRLETVSKVFAPGTRLGFMVAYKPLIDAVIDHTNCSTTAPSGISQATLLTTVDQFGGVEGWVQWCIKVSKAYTDRKNVFLKALFESEAYEKGYFTVREPDAGMFIALEINLPESDQDYRLGMEGLDYKCLEAGVEIVLGKNMAVTAEYSKIARFIRVTVATAEDDDELSEAASRLARGISLYFENTD